jgi:tyrosine-protein phosphatase YwqE
MGNNDGNSNSNGMSDQLHKAVRQGVSQVVASTNAALGSLQRSTEGIRRPISTSFHQAATAVGQAATTLHDAYGQRRQYGPYIVAGSAVVTGGITKLRGRGKLASALVATSTGVAAYAVVYDLIPLSMEDVPDILFGRK